MKGKHRIIIEAERLKYEFEIKRNITVIQGDSATGKTTLVDLIQTYGRYGEESGISISSDVPCVAFSGDASLWKAAIGSYENSIVFFDEDYSFIFSKDFAKEIQATSNYYVIITRQPLYNLPYSTKEIYGIRTTGKYHFPEKVYHEFYPLYEDSKITDNLKIVLLIEDQKSGFQFFSHALPQVNCISSQGNSSISTDLQALPSDNPVVVLADGAAFGAYISKVMAIAKDRKNVGMFFPESFEWIILKSGVLDIKNLDDILINPEDYIDGNQFFSWEQFFTNLLESSTQNDPIKQYRKSSLNSFYLDGKNKEQILSVLPEELRKQLTLPS